MNWGEEAQRRLIEISGCSTDTDGVTRFPFTAEHEAANRLITGWMERAGLSVRMDAAGTLIGRKDGPDSAPTFLIGSHQDSVRSGGRYDGIMGVALGCLALEKLASDGTALPFAVEVLAFADEEGVRFPTALLGPRALAGTVDPAVFEMTDRAGTTLGQALRDFGGEPASVASLKRSPQETLGYLEIHIEQGPVLEQAGTPLGIVTGICGIERNSVTFTGETGHAGTVPMAGRRDALVAAADFIAAIDKAARDLDGLRATIGTLSLKPDVVNAIPRLAELSLEIRDLDDAQRAEFAQFAVRIGNEIAARSQTGFEMVQTYRQPAVPCSAPLIERLSNAAQVEDRPAPHMPSGATHDASAMADLCPIAMLFVRCKGGVSHTPEEFAAPEDMNAAILAAARFLAERTPIISEVLGT
ncbi:MAG: Zn-dependent hydrolase [Rhodobacteraceae bacterium]|nr:Zn-dependent hydrolase [Paracoccaceae bacterium]